LIVSNHPDREEQDKLRKLVPRVKEKHGEACVQAPLQQEDPHHREEKMGRNPKIKQDKIVPAHHLDGRKL
jgi:hypothetical protein